MICHFKHRLENIVKYDLAVLLTRDT